MTDEIQLTEQGVYAMRAEFERHQTRGLDKIPVTRIGQVVAIAVQLNQSELKEMEKEGNDGRGLIGFDRLLALLSLQLQARQGTNFYRTVFNMIDTSGRGYLSFDQLRDLILKLQELTPEMELSDNDVEDLVSAVKQKSKANQVTFDDFYSLVAE